MGNLQDYHLDVDLTQGVIPVSRAASALAALLRQARSERRPIVITQKGYPTCVLIDVELYAMLRALVDGQLSSLASA